MCITPSSALHNSAVYVVTNIDSSAENAERKSSHLRIRWGSAGASRTQRADELQDVINLILACRTVLDHLNPLLRHTLLRVDRLSS